MTNDFSNNNIKHNCWICNNECTNYILLPNVEDTYVLPRDKRIYLIKKIDAFELLYYILCYSCINDYLYHYPMNVKRISAREIGTKY